MFFTLLDPPANLKAGLIREGNNDQIGGSYQTRSNYIMSDVILEAGRIVKP
jgi:hypothetical protein